MLKKVLLIGIVMALLPTVFVESYRGLSSGLNPFLNTVALVLVFLVIAAGWALVWWLDSRKEGFRTAELFLAGAFCWMLIGVYYHELFDRPGGIAILFGVFAAIYHWFPDIAGRPLVKVLGVIHFWASYICSIALFHPVADFLYRYQGYIGFVYMLLDTPAFLYLWVKAAVAAQGVFLCNLIYSLLQRRR